MHIHTYYNYWWCQQDTHNACSMTLTLPYWIRTVASATWSTLYRPSVHTRVYRGTRLCEWLAQTWHTFASVVLVCQLEMEENVMARLMMRCCRVCERPCRGLGSSACRPSSHTEVSDWLWERKGRGLLVSPTGLQGKSVCTKIKYSHFNLFFLFRLWTVFIRKCAVHQLEYYFCTLEKESCCLTR